MSALSLAPVFKPEVVTPVFPPRDQAADILLERFRRHAPSFHLDGSSDWSVSEETIRFLAKHVPENAATLETGAGLSTAMFALLGARHTCITPDAGEVRRIGDFCRAAAIPTADLAFEIDYSENALPRLKKEPLDFVLIDGGHGFPMPIIDWYYAATHLKEGGVVLIDDTHLWSVSILVDMLKTDDGWAHMGRVGRRTHAFRKVAPFAYKEFCFQPYVVRKSRLASITTRLLTAFDLLRAGDFAEFGRRLRRA
jgi:predicted O-methyltransferase YrrM